ncbi:hypothetical protein ACF068_28470 [Streptomyces sp. NPDC016309]|uniref:hypothetical protein n=1 Tax=Streptomyces sp. NPDC016309 TaxID=3364965 RepID=UPI00370115E5
MYDQVTTTISTGTANNGAKVAPQTAWAVPPDRYDRLSTVNATTSCHSAPRTRTAEAVRASAARVRGRSGRHRALTSSSGNRAADSARTDRPTTYRTPHPGMP